MPHERSQAGRKGRFHHRQPRGVRRTLFGSGLTWWEWLWLGSIYGCVILGMAFLGATARPYYLSADRYNGPTLIYSSDGILLARLFDEYRVPVTLDQVPGHTIHAILAAEDTRFFEHNGLDARGIGRAFLYNLRHRQVAQGGSTITQQLVRYELLDHRRSLPRKIREAMLAIRVERAYTKQQILARYLNAVYFGGGAYGIGAAAQLYFGKRVDQLTPAESALLAGLIRAPSEGNPRLNLREAKRRQHTVLLTMMRRGWLSEPDRRRAEQQPIVIRSQTAHPWVAPYVVESVRRFLLTRYGRETVYRGGMVIYTTIDSRMQRVAERALRQAVNAGRRQRVGNGALIAIEPETGYIRAMVGGTSFWHSQFNRATQAHRQPGSAFKVFVYQAAIDKGHSLGEYALDAPLTIGDWSPHNYGNSYHGVVTLQDALALSLNSVAVRLTAKMSPYAVIAAAHQAGITSELRPNLTLALGASEVTPFEMARAFATFANDGISIDPSLIKSVQYRNQILYQHRPIGHQRVKPETAFLLTQGLRTVILSGTGRRANIGRPAAGKTGTSNRYRDAWFVGYTPQLSTAVWLGNDDRHPMLGVAGGSLPAQAWAMFMQSALRGKPVRDFILPPGVVEIQICPVSGKLALPTCPSPRTVYVAAKNAPTETCDIHAYVSVAVCSTSGLLPNATCPSIVRQVFSAYDVPTDVCPIKHPAVTPQQPERPTTDTPQLPAPQGRQQPENTPVTTSTPPHTGTTPPATKTDTEEMPDTSSPMPTTAPEPTVVPTPENTPPQVSSPSPSLPEDEPVPVDTPPPTTGEEQQSTWEQLVRWLHHLFSLDWLRHEK